MVTMVFWRWSTIVLDSRLPVIGGWEARKIAAVICNSLSSGTGSVLPRVLSVIQIE